MTTEQLKTASRTATQDFAVLDILVSHCGQMLTPDKVDQIHREIVKAMREGPTSWAFTPQP